MTLLLKNRIHSSVGFIRVESSRFPPSVLYLVSLSFSFSLSLTPLFLLPCFLPACLFSFILPWFLFSFHSLYVYTVNSSECVEFFEFPEMCTRTACLFPCSPEAGAPFISITDMTLISGINISAHQNLCYKLNFYRDRTTNELKTSPTLESLQGANVWQLRFFAGCLAKQ